MKNKVRDLYYYRAIIKHYDHDYMNDVERYYDYDGNNSNFVKRAIDEEKRSGGEIVSIYQIGQLVWTRENAGDI